MNLACGRSYRKTYLVQGFHLVIVAGLMPGAVLARTLLKLVGNRRRLAHAGVLVLRIIAFEVDEVTRTVAILIDIELVLVVDIAVDLPIDRVSVRRSRDRAYTHSLHHLSVLSAQIGYILKTRMRDRTNTGPLHFPSPSAHIVHELSADRIYDRRIVRRCSGKG